MAKSTVTYWNPSNPENGGQWQPISGLEGMAEELTSVSMTNRVNTHG